MFKMKSGLIGAIFLFLFLNVFTLLHFFSIIDLKPIYFFMIFIAVLWSMLYYEMKTNTIEISLSSVSLLSVLYRYISLLIPFLIFYFIITFTPFQDNFIKYIKIDFIKLFYQYILISFIFIAPFYIFFTLKYRGAAKYEFNDYAILIMVGSRAIYKRNNLYKNRRVKKVLYVFFVNSFFLTLMISFFLGEFLSYYKYFIKVFSVQFFELSWIDTYRNVYHLLLAMLFFIDVGIALVGYMSASRWLGNRVRSVDMTFLGWFVALVCYPPFNGYWSTWLTSYKIYDTHQLITNDYINAFILFVMILLYFIYVLSTIEMGFKFSNLTNKGIVTTGTYAYVRHPAYMSKNITWIIDNTFVWTNIYALVAFLSWNLMYVLRAITEEIHLSSDKEYVKYMSLVPNRFIPYFFYKPLKQYTWCKDY